MTPLHAHPASRARQGLGTVAVAVLLLLLMSIGVFYANRNILFEQRTAVNQARASEAQEIAEGGMEWVIGMLNYSKKVSTTCADDTTGTDFRDRYLAQSGVNFAPVANVRVGCKRTGANAWTCSCPTAGNPSLGTAEAPNFTVAFEAVAGNTTVVRATVTGCTAQAGNCLPGGNNAADGVATVSALLKTSPGLPGISPAALTCGKTCDISGSYDIYNTDVSTNGILINAGSGINAGGGDLGTIAGQPAAAAQIANDSSLAALASSDADCSKSKIFNSYFGTTMEEYKNLPRTTVLSCGSTSDCVTKIMNAYDSGSRSFYFTSDVQLSGNLVLGSPTEPVIFVTPYDIKINGTWDIYGLIFSNNYENDSVGTGSSNINGALITCGDFKTNGNGKINYNRDVLDTLRGDRGTIVRVPGSWRDWN